MAHLACKAHGKRVIVIGAVGRIWDSERVITMTFHRAGNGERCSATTEENEVKPVLVIAGNTISPFDVLMNTNSTILHNPIRREAARQGYARANLVKPRTRRRPSSAR